MATTKSLPAISGPELNRDGAHQDGTHEDGGTGALVLMNGDQQDLILARGPIARIPVQLDVAVPVREFRVRKLLALEPGQVIETRWANGEDMPLASGQVQLAWSEFEVQENKLAVRITRLA